MVDLDRSGVERLPLEQRRTGWQAEQRRLDHAAAAVEHIAEHGRADRCEVDPDLVGAAGPRRNPHQRRSPKPLEHLIPRHSSAAGGMIAADGHLLPLVGMDADRQIDLVGVELRLPLGDGQVGLGDAAALKLLRERMVGRFAPGHHDHAAGVAVEAVDDARPGWPAGRREPRGSGVGPFEMPLEGVGERAFPVALGRMHHHPRRLVHNRDRVVDVEKLKRDLLGGRPDPRGLRHGEHHKRARPELHGSAGHDAVETHPAGLDGPSKK